MENTAFDTLYARRVVPVAVVERAEDAVPLAEALLEAGLNLIEITLRTRAAYEAIAAIRDAFPEMRAGAGTILDAAAIPRLKDMGAQFGVSPGLNERTVETAIANDFPMIPGVLTPSEVERALVYGLKLLKFFPAEPAGGAQMLQSMAAPYAHKGLRFIPLGGVNAANAAEYFKIPSVAAVGGSWFVDKKLLAARRFSEITRLTREALALAGGAVSGASDKRSRQSRGA